MASDPVEKRAWTPEEYLDWERRQPTKHAYFRGEVTAMESASRAHSLIVGNLVAALRHALGDRPWEVYPSNMRLKIAATGLYTYPDGSVVCDEPVFEDDEADTLMNPCVLIEVLSAATEAHDRGEKFEQYRSIASLADYLLVSQSQVLVEHHQRQPDGTWVLREARAGGRVELGSIDCVLAVDELYRKVFAASG